MGRPKALVGFAGEPLVRRAVRVLADGGTATTATSSAARAPRPNVDPIRISRPPSSAVAGADRAAGVSGWRRGPTHAENVIYITIEQPIMIGIVSTDSATTRADVIRLGWSG
jgi:hypothetical protein